MQGFPDELLKRKENAQVLTEGEERRGEERKESGEERRGEGKGESERRRRGAREKEVGFFLYYNFFESENHHVRDAVAESFAGAEE